MSRFLILILVNLPLIMAGLLGSLIDYKTERISKTKYLLITFLWLIILSGLIMAHTVNEYFYHQHRAHHVSLSLLDVFETTGIIYILFMANRSRIKADHLERRVQDLHQEMSIALSERR